MLRCDRAWVSRSLAGVRGGAHLGLVFPPCRLLSPRRLTCVCSYGARFPKWELPQGLLKLSLAPHMPSLAKEVTRPAHIQELEVKPHLLMGGVAKSNCKGHGYPRRGILCGQLAIFLQLPSIYSRANMVELPLLLLPVKQSIYIS